jgi:hypothetical protein
MECGTEFDYISKEGFGWFASCQYGLQVFNVDLAKN